jgi:O-antigen ligase
MKAIPVYIFMVTLLIRPQDWVPGIVDLPTGIILIPLGVCIGLPNALFKAKQYQIPQNVLLVAYLIITFVSTLVSTDFGEATDHAIIYFKRILIFFITIWLLDSKKALLKTSTLFKLLSLFLAFQAILQALTGESVGGLTPFPGYQEIRVRWYGDWDGPNVFAIIFVIATGLSIEYIFGKHGMVTRAFHALLSITYLAAIYCTNSRGAVLGVICCLLFYFCMKEKRFIWLSVAAACITVILLYGPSRMAMVHSGESSAHERTWLWEQGLQMLVQHPLLGVGRGQFVKLADPNLIAHNNYVQNFSELGLVGFFLFSCILWFSFKGVYMVGYGSQQGNSDLSALGRSLCSALVGFSACTFFVVMELDIYYFLLGFAVATFLVGRTVMHLDDIALDWKAAATVVILMAGVICAVWFAAVTHIL